MEKDVKQPIVRFAPSPTGLFHVGSARTALFNYLFSQNVGGKFLLRIEDTDKERSKKEYEQNIIDALSWLNIKYDEPIIRQSERSDHYKTYIQQMIDDGKAYLSKEESGERDEVIRFRNPNKIVKFTDVIRGEIAFNTTELGDFVIAKSLSEPLYHLAVVVDDHKMGVTHVIRGEDHISNTPRQILIQEAIGAVLPMYAHLPLILGPDKSKLSKRHGATAVVDYKKEGYLPQAFSNYLALLGWSPGNNKEIFTWEELVKNFSLEKIQKGGAVFNPDKLDWVNKQHVQKLEDEEFLEYVENFLPEDIKKLEHFSKTALQSILPVLRERVQKFSDIKVMANEGELEYYFEDPDYFAEGLLWRDDKDLSITKEHLEKIQVILNNLDKSLFIYEKIKGSIWSYAEEKGKGSVLWPMRYALSGMERSPDPFELSSILGKEKTLHRITIALKKIAEKIE